MNGASVLLCLCLAGFFGESCSIQVNTDVGVFIGHEYVSTFPEVASGIEFLGIPYAEPPVGERRFAKPVIKPSLSQPLNASTYGPSCLPNERSEDCLTLNIFAPNDVINGAKKAVMVWIHGGGFVTGGLEYKDPRNLAVFGDVMIVSANYRMGVFGFLSTGDTSSAGNYGLWDQQLAIKWVNNNIDKFGGDKSKITLVGVASGAASVTYQAMYKGNQGLFQRAIAVSGTLYTRWAYEKSASKRATQFGEALNCDTSSSANLVQCLRGKTVNDLLSTAEKLESTMDNPLFAPGIDGSFIDYNPASLYEDSKEVSSRYWPDVDFLLGINKYDGSVMTEFIPSTAYNDGTSKDVFEGVVDELTLRTTDDEFAKPVFETLLSCKYSNHGNNSAMETVKSLLRLLTDFYFTVPAIKSALNYKAYSNKNVFLYLLSHTSYMSRLPFQGASHRDAYPFLSGFSGVTKLSTVPADEKTFSKIMMTYWTNFAKSGNPNTPVTEHITAQWPEYDTDEKGFMEFGETLADIKAGDHLYADRIAFWLKMVPTMKRHIASQCPTSGASGLLEIQMFTLVSTIVAALVTLT